MKKSLKVLSFVFLTSLGVGALALNNNVVITNAEETDVTYVDTTFFVQAKARTDEKALDIIISFDEFSFPQDANKERDMGIYEQSDVEAYSSLNFFNYIQVNGVDLPRWGQTSENGLTKAAYNPINGLGCEPYPSIVLRYNYSQETYPNGFPLETVTIKKDFEFPSYYLKTGKEGEKVIYRNVSELKCEKGQYNWEWINKGSSDVTTIEYIENEENPTLPGYLAFKLTNSDYSSFDGEISKGWYTLTNNVTDQNEDHIVTMDGKFIEEMPGYYLAKVNEIEENITSINVPKGTIFPSIQAIKLMKNTYNSGNCPATGFATQKDKVFVKKGNEFVCEEDLAELKQEAISLLEESFIESDYEESYWEYIQS